MIVASSGRYLAVSGHDHETVLPWVPGIGFTGGCVPRAPMAVGAGRAAAAGHTVNVASITRRRADLARCLWDLAKTPLSGRDPHPLVTWSRRMGRVELFVSW